MDIQTFHSFVKTAARLRLTDSNMPDDYIQVHEAVMERYPTLQKLAVFGHAADVAGLGILAAPSVQEMRGKPMSEKKKSMYEVGGLGLLAAEPAYKVFKHFRP